MRVLRNVTTGKPVVTMRVGADNWRTNSGKAGAAIMPVRVVADLGSDAQFVGIHCPSANDYSLSAGLLRQIPPGPGVTPVTLLAPG